ncbi:MAG TPA: histidine kinase, partial [Methanolinea sp.]|nr:histidine kinase [Methanolinea sp.]
SVSVRRENNTLFVEYRDTGVGIPGDLDWRKPASLGLRLVNSLVSQLNGSIELDRSQGTAFTLVLQEKE